MIKELVQKVAGIFEGAYLLASVLPALLFLFVVGATFALVAGPLEAWEAIKSWKIWGESTVETILFVIALLTFIYLLSSLRPLFLKFWTGTVELALFEPFYSMGRYLQRRTYESLRRGIPDPPSIFWSNMLNVFQDDVQHNWDKGAQVAPATEIQRLQNLVKNLNAANAQGVLNEVIKAYLSSTGNSLAPVYQDLYARLNELKKEEARQRLGLADLDRRFGKLEAMAPTELGNVIQAYNDYPFERYCMEGEVFWSRLQKVISPEFRVFIQDQQTLLDFSLTAASLSVLYALLALGLGPWLWTDWIWIGLAAGSVLVAYLFYRLGCVAAWRLGDFIRASFDLFRLDLLTSLGSVPPRTVKEERALWSDLSKLLVYGGEFAEIKKIKLQVQKSS